MRFCEAVSLAIIHRYFLSYSKGLLLEIVYVSLSSNFGQAFSGIFSYTHKVPRKQTICPHRQGHLAY